MLRRMVARSAVVVGIVGATSLGVVYTSGPAQADTIGTIVQIGAVAGGVATRAAPGVLAGAAGAEAGGAGLICATGVGCVVLGVAAVAAIGLYATKDIWVPLVVKGLGGDGTSGASGNAVGSGTISATSGEIGTWTSNGGTGLQVLVEGTMKIPGVVSSYGVRAECRNPDGTTYEDYTQGYAGTGAFSKTVILCESSSPPNQVGRVITSVTLELMQGRPGATVPEDAVWWWTRATPLTSVTTEVTCTQPDGTTYTRSADTPVSGSTDPAVLVKACDAGGVPTKVRTFVNGETQPGWSQDLGPKPEDLRNYPLCASAACDYAVNIDGKRCLSGDPECANWELIRKTTPSRVTCTYGPYLVSCDLLDWMERAYEDGPRTATKVNTDGDNDTTDTEVKAPTIPRPTVTETATATSTTTPTIKSPVEQCLNGEPGCTPVVDPEHPKADNDKCWPNGWGAVNPANWVLQPIRCALQWAFVPPPGTMTGLKTAVADGWDNSTPGRWTLAIPGIWGGIPDSSGGCLGPGISMGFLSDGTGVPNVIHPFSACDYPVSYMATVAKAASSFAIAFFGGLRCVQLLGTGFGWVPMFSESYRGQVQTERINEGFRNLT